MELNHCEKEDTSNQIVQDGWEVVRILEKEINWVVPPPSNSGK